MEATKTAYSKDKGLWKCDENELLRENSKRTRKLRGNSHTKTVMCIKAGLKKGNFMGRDVFLDRIMVKR